MEFERQIVCGGEKVRLSLDMIMPEVSRARFEECFSSRTDDLGEWLKLRRRSDAWRLCGIRWRFRECLQEQEDKITYGSKSYLYGETISTS